MREGQYATAASLFDRAQASPHLVREARLLQGVCLHANGNGRGGEAALERAGAARDVIAIRLWVAMLLYLEGVRRLLRFENPSALDAALDANFAGQRKCHPHPEEWCAVFPLSVSWHRQLRPWIESR